MEQLKGSQGKQFIREWLYRLCLQGITSINLEHDPGLRGMMAVTKYLEEKTDRLLFNDGMRQIYRGFFQPDTEWRYPKFYSFLAQSTNVVGQPDQNERDKGDRHAKGYAFDISGFARIGIIWIVQCSLPDDTLKFAEELAEVFAQAYKGTMPGK